MSARAIHSPAEVAARRLRRAEARAMDKIIEAAEARGEVAEGTVAAREALKQTARPAQPRAAG